MLCLWIILAVLAVLFGWVVFFGSPYIPSHSRDLEEAFSKLYPLSKSDVLVDLGSGDGKILRKIASKVSRAVGYEINPLLVCVSNCFNGRYKNVETKLADFWGVRLPDDVTVVYVFSVSRDLKKLNKFLQSESTRLNRQLFVVVYGPELPGRKFKKRTAAHFLYEFNPLQHEKA